jgi:hypothetical protein
MMLNIERRSTRIGCLSIMIMQTERRFDCIPDTLTLKNEVYTTVKCDETQVHMNRNREQ